MLNWFEEIWSTIVKKGSGGNDTYTLVERRTFKRVKEEEINQSRESYQHMNITFVLLSFSNRTSFPFLAGSRSSCKRDARALEIKRRKKEGGLGRRRERLPQSQSPLDFLRLAVPGPESAIRQGKRKK